jgi:two-component system, response regulator
MDDNVVLFVEDSPDDVDLTLYSFKKHGFPHKVVVARDGLQALDYLFGTGTFAGRDRTLAPILVLLDLKLPKVSGFEVLERLRADRHLRHVPVAILTSSSEDKDRIEAEALGANIYLRKPMNTSQSAEMVKRIDALLAPFR